MQPRCQQPLALAAGDKTNIQQENLFHSLSRALRRQRERLPRFALLGEPDTPPPGTESRPPVCDESDCAYSCPALRQRARIPKCGGRQGCRTCIGVRDQFHKWLRRWSREADGVETRSRAVPPPSACALLC